MSTPLPIENPYCLFCGEMVVNPTASSQCGGCGALACEACRKQGNTVCTECGGVFGQGASTAAPPTPPPTAPQPRPSYPPPSPPVNTTPSAPAPEAKQAAPPPTTPSPTASQPSAPPPSAPQPTAPQPTASAPVTPPMPGSAPQETAALSQGQFDLAVHQTSADGWKSQGMLIHPLLGPRLIFWSLVTVLSAGAIGLLAVVWFLVNRGRF